MLSPSFRLFASLIMGTTLLAACAESPQAQAPTSAPAPTLAPAPGTVSQTAGPTAASAPSEDDIKAGIQQTLDIYAKAYNDNNSELLKQAADQTNAPFRRFIQTRFDTFQESIRAGQRHNYKVNAILKKFDFGFVLVRVESGGAVADWTFRQVDGRWVMSEPTEQQIGKREKVEGDHFIYFVYPWSKDVNPKIMELMEQARSIVVERLGKAPDRKATVTIRPTFSSGGITNPNVLASYRRDSSDEDQIIVYSPESYIFRFYDPAVGWEGELLSNLTHEYTHLVNNRSFTPIARMSDWMFEGLAEYVSDPNAARNRGVPLAVQSDKIIPIIDTSGQVNKQDLQHLTILEKDVSLAYGLATTLVDYINETYAGMDGWWEFVATYDKAQNLDKALQDAFDVTFEQFDKDWRAWLKQKYG